MSSAAVNSRSRVLRVLVRGFFVVTLVILGLLVWFVGTQSGTRTLLKLGAASIDEFSLGSVDGRLVGPLNVYDLSWTAEGASADIQHLMLDWQPRALFSGRILIDQLTGDGVDLVLDAALDADANPQDEAQPIQLPEALRAPLDLFVHQARFGALIYRRGETSLIVDEITLSGSWVAEQLAITGVSVTTPEFKLSAAGDAVLAGDYPVDFAGVSNARLPGYAGIAGDFTAVGNRQVLELVAQIDAPYSLAMAVTLNDLLGTPAVYGTVNIADAPLQSITSDWPAVVMGGQLEVAGPFAELESTGRITGVGGDAKLELDYRATLDGERVQLERFALIADERAQPLLATGYVDFSAGLAAELEISATAIDPAFYADLFGQPDLAQQLGGALDLQLQAQLEQTAAGELNVLLPQATLTGVLLDQPLALDAALHYSPAALEARAVALEWGPNKAYLSGRVADNAKLSWQLDATDLEPITRLVGAPITGQITGNGEVAGSRAAPQLSGSIDGKNLRFGQNQLNQFTAEFALGSHQDAPLELLVWANGLELASQSIREVGLQANGSTANHRFDAQAETESISVSLAGAGAGGPSQQWRFSLDTLGVEHAPAGVSLPTDAQAQNAWHRWSLDGTTTGILALEQLMMADFCLVHVAPQPEGRVCLDLSQQGEQLRAQGRLEGIQLAFFNGLLPNDLRMQGVVQGRFDWRGVLFDSTVELTTSAIELASAQSTDRALLRFAPGQIQLSNSGAGAQLDLRLPLDSGAQPPGSLGQAAQLDATGLGLLGALNWSKPAAASIVNDAADSLSLAKLPMTGEFRFGLKDFSWLAQLLPEIADIDGGLDSRFQVSGSLAAPLIDGAAQLQAARIALGEFGIELEDVQINLETSQSQALITGQLGSGDGQLSLAGELDWAREMRAELSLQGREFLLSDTPTAMVRVSPDLKASLVAQSLNLSGSIELPTAEIRLAAIPTNGISVSQDQRILGEDVAEAPLPFEVSADVALTLGDAVSFAGLGLTSELRGELQIKERPDAPTTAAGEIEIVTGSYKAYGQDLSIENGKVLFVGGPITEPGLDLRATRQATPDVLVGVNVAGTLSGPDLHVFSEPSLPQSDQLSYLILGRPIQSNSSAQNTLLQQAAMAIGVKGGELVTNRLSKKVGLDTLAIESEPGETNAQAALVIGKYLSPRLYVSYGYGLFNPISTLNMEYQFSELWRIVTRSTNEATGGDVQWVLER